MCPPLAALEPASASRGKIRPAFSAGVDIGLSPDWDESAAIVRLSPGGSVVRVTLTHRSDDHQDAWMCFSLQITGAAPSGQIELPKPEATVSLEQHTPSSGWTASAIGDAATAYQFCLVDNSALSVAGPDAPFV